MPKLQSGVWQTDPRIRRVSYGLAGRMERFRAIGNGQVPVVAATAFSILKRELS